MDERTKWDDRWVDAVIVEKNEGNGEDDPYKCVIYMKGKASPIPGLFSQRDMIYQAFQRLEKGQDGNDCHYTCGASIEHPDYPAG